MTTTTSPTPTPAPNPTLSADDLRAIREPLAAANAAFAASHPGEPEGRQPTHTVYGGAQLFQHTTTTRMGELALRALDTYAPTPEALAEALHWSPATPVLPRSCSTPREQRASRRACCIRIARSRSIRSRFHFLTTSPSDAATRYCRWPRCFTRTRGAFRTPRSCRAVRWCSLDQICGRNGCWTCSPPIA